MQHANDIPNLRAKGPVIIRGVEQPKMRLRSHRLWKASSIHCHCHDSVSKVDFGIDYRIIKLKFSTAENLSKWINLLHRCNNILESTYIER